MACEPTQVGKHRTRASHRSCDAQQNHSGFQFAAGRAGGPCPTTTPYLENLLVDQGLDFLRGQRSIEYRNFIQTSFPGRIAITSAAKEQQVQIAQ